MKKYIYILLSLIVTFAWGCKSHDLDVLETETESETSNCVEVLEDGRLLITGSISGTTFSDVSVSTRADIDWTALENNIVDGWCLVFGVDPYAEDGDVITDGAQYTTGSPLIQKVPLQINANGMFFVTLTPYEGVAFLRIVVNLTDRENVTLSGESVKCWVDYEDADVTPYAYKEDGETLREPTTSDDLSGIATFGEYKDQSVGLDGIYNIEYAAGNTTQPDPLSPSTAFPMSSIGFVINDGISEDSVADVFGTKIYLIRACSKVDITVSTTEFQLKEVYLIDCAQEARIRSTVLTTSGTDGAETTTDFGVPVDLGGTISYLALEEEVSNDSEQTGTTDTDNTSSPMYIYPNSGGDYDSNDGAVDKSVNPQYVIIKGRAGRYFVDEITIPAYSYENESGETIDVPAETIPAHYEYGYDTDGYYKIALKAQYPLSYRYYDDGSIYQDPDTGAFQVETWSDLTYDILRNTHFNIDLIGVDKPGYKTYEDAANPNNPASNISYSITIMGSDGRKEILVSNGTYYVELDASRIYAKGYSKFSGSVQFSITPNDADVNYQHPAIYVMADYGVDVTGCSYTTNNETTTVTKTDIDNTDYADDQDSHVDDYWFKVDSSSYATAVTIDYEATYSGRLRLRIGDILKFIPVRFEEDVVASAGGKLSFYYEDETSFAYDDIKVADDDDSYTTTLSKIKEIIGSDGVVSKNSDNDSLEVRAKIYNDDGIAMLYFIQNVLNSDEQAEGNTIKLDENIATAGGVAGSDQSGTLVEVVSEALIDSGYTTVYIEETYENDLFSSKGTANDADNVFQEIEANIAGAIANEELDDTYTYSLDLSGIERASSEETKGNNAFVHLKTAYFSNCVYLKSLILPSTITQIWIYAFSGCENLETVVIGSATSVATVDSIKANAFENMAIGATITIYNSAKITDKNNADENTTYTLETVTDTDGNVLYYKYVYTVITSDLNK